MPGRLKFISLKKALRKSLRVGVFFVLMLVLISITASLLLLIPSVQTYMTKKITDTLSNKSQSKIEVRQVRIAFPKTVRLAGIYAEDTSGDTLLYANRLDIDVALFPLVRRQILLDHLTISGLRGKLVRKPGNSTFNYDAIISAFAKGDKEKSPSIQPEPKPWSIDVSGLVLKDIRLEYADHPDSTFIFLNLNRLNIDANQIDPEMMVFDLDEIDISGTSISITLPAGSDEDKKSEQKSDGLPKIRLKRFQISDTNFSYQTADDLTSFQAYIRNATIAPENIDLQNELVRIDHFLLDSAFVEIRLPQDSIPSPTEPKAVSDVATLNSDHAFGDFAWNIEVKKVDIQKTWCSVDLDQKPATPDSMDFMHLALSSITLKANDLNFNKNEAAGFVKELSVKEQSGFRIERFSTKFQVGNHDLQIRNLDFSTGKTFIAGNATISYPSLREIGQKPDELKLDLDMEAGIETAELGYFTTFFSDNPAFRKVNHITIKKLKLDGQLSDLKIQEMQLTTGDSTFLNLSAMVKGLPSSQVSIEYNLPEFHTTNRDLSNIFPDEAIPENFILPKFIRIRSNGKTDLKNGFIQFDMDTDIGSASLEADLSEQNLTASLLLNQWELGTLLSDTTFGAVTIKSELSGTMDGLVPVDFSSTTEVVSVQWNDRLFERLVLGVNLNNNKYSYDATFTDSAISLNAAGVFFIQDSIKNLTLELDIDTFELSAFNLSESPFASRANVNFDVAYTSTEELNAKLKVSDLWFFKPEDRFFIDEMTLEAIIDYDIKDFIFSSPVFDATLKGNTRVSELRDAFIDHIDLYLELPDSIVSEKDFQFQFDLEMKNPAFLSFLVEDLKTFNLEKCDANYTDAKDLLTAEIVIRDLEYKNIQLKNLSFTFDTQPSSASVDFYLGELSAGSVTLQKMGLNAELENESISTRFYSMGPGDSLQYELSYLIRRLDSAYQIRIDPARLMINYNRWAVPEDNLIQIVNNVVSAQSAAIAFEGQKISLNPMDRGISLHFENFQLENISQIFDEDSLIHQMSGFINGSIQLPGLLTNEPGLFSKIEITDFKTGTTRLGNFRSEISKNPHSPLNFEISLENQENSIHLAGILPFSESEQDLNLIANVDVRNIGYYHPFVRNYLSELDGKLNARFAVSGTPGNPRIHGYSNFENLLVVIPETNTKLLTNGMIKVDNNLLVFDKLQIQDAMEKKLNITGEIDLRNWRDPVFDVHAKAEEFLLLNSDNHRTEMVEGQLKLGIDVKLTGRKTKLKVTNHLKILDGTDINYTFPGNDLEMITDEGIVEYTVFGAMEENLPLEHKTSSFDDSIKTMLRGLDFTTQLEIDPLARFTIYIDPNSGDFTQFNLHGKLEYTYSDVASGRLNGALIFTNGFYELSFYELVKKRFEYLPGSMITWSGEIMDGDINFSAKYTVRTNSVGLVSNEISSYERGMYNQRLPYDVILKVENKLSEPEISFLIDLSERYRSSYPTLDAKLNYLNQPALESERNKQVFALLVGGTFIPEDPGMAESSGGANFATTAARNSINAIMTQQLNNLTDKIIVGVDVDLGLNSFDDYSSGNAQTRTQLDVKVSKNLFNDRVSAEMESHINIDGSPNQVGQQSSAGMNEFAVSYKLTKSGSYRIKAFSENAYDIYDGEIQKSGIAFIFIKEFDRFGKNPKTAAEDEPVNATDQPEQPEN